MLLERRAEEPPLPAGVEIRRLDSPDRGAPTTGGSPAASYADLGFPPEVFAQYTVAEGLIADNLIAFLAYLDGEPVGIAMTIVTDGVAGIYWVGSLGEARGKGIGRAVTAAATNAGLDLGADVASLQASPMGRPIYEAMGYRDGLRLPAADLPHALVAVGLDHVDLSRLEAERRVAVGDQREGVAETRLCQR